MSSTERFPIAVLIALIQKFIALRVPDLDVRNVKESSIDAISDKIHLELEASELVALTNNDKKIIETSKVAEALKRASDLQLLGKMYEPGQMRHKGVYKLSVQLFAYLLESDDDLYRQFYRFVRKKDPKGLDREYGIFLNDINSSSLISFVMDKLVKDERSFTENFTATLKSVTRDVLVNDNNQKSVVLLNYLNRLDKDNHGAVLNAISLTPLLGTSKRRSLRVDNDFTKSAFYDIFNDSKGFLLTHSISPKTDSIFVLCDLGRFLRYQMVFQKRAAVMLTSNDFFLQNKLFHRDSTGSSKRIKISSAALDSASKFRTSLYGLFGFTAVTNFDYMAKENLQSFVEGEEVTKFNVQDDVRGVFRSEKFYFVGDYNTYGPVVNTSEEHFNTLNNVVDLYSQIETKLKKEKDDDVTKYRFAPEAQTINFIKEYFKIAENDSVGSDTWSYFFHQLSQQLYFDGWTKIAVESEMAFDQCFEKLQLPIKKQGFNLFGIYFPQYNIIDNEEAYSVIPYYYPSGISKTKNIKVEDKLIYVTDVDEDIICKKLSLYKNHSTELAHIMSDYLSLVSYAMVSTNVSAKMPGLETIEKDIEDLMTYANDISITRNIITHGPKNVIKEVKRFGNYLLSEKNHNESPLWVLPFCIKYTPVTLKLCASIIAKFNRKVIEKTNTNPW